MSSLYFSFGILAAFAFGTSVLAANFNELSEGDQARVKAGELVTVPVKMDRKRQLLDGTFFRYVKKIQPEQFAAVFYDYDHQYTFVPGMTITKIVKEEGRKALVTHHINPIVFLEPNAQDTLPPSLFEAGTYTYELDEELLNDGRKYTITWVIPENEKVLGENEVGRIAFEPFGEGDNEGTLITYENGTLPFLYKYIFRNRNHPHLEKWLAGPAQRYYRETIENLIVRTQEVVRTGEIDNELKRFQSALAP